MKKRESTKSPSAGRLVFALAGNQNSGKTTLFNALTGSNQRVGNFPGVTVEKKEGRVRGTKDAAVVDLPGIYSLAPYTAEEVVTRDFLIGERPNGIINIVDATNLERNLYLTLQLMELNIPMVVALNMMDEVMANGHAIDVEGLQEALGVDIVPISAGKKEGITELVSRAVRVAEAGEGPKRTDFCSGPVHRAIHAVCHIIEDRLRQTGLPARYAATRLVESDALVEKQLGLDSGQKKIVGDIVREMEHQLGTDREAAMADMRYAFIEQVCRNNLVRGKETREQARSVRIDKVLTHKIWSLPIFFGIMLLIFWLTFVVIGQPLSDLLSSGIDVLAAWLDGVMTRARVAPMLQSLVIDGVFSGVGSVLSFLPTIIVLFFFLSILEDTGYMARVAFVMDKLLRKIGLSGRSFVPMLLGFGCSVPAVMATRTLPSERDRKMTVLLVPFMSCSAKLPIYGMITGIFFENRKALVMISLYILGIVIGVLYGLLLKGTILKSDPVPFVMELPAYRFPSARSVALHLWQRAKDFLTKAFTIILMSSIVIWLLQRYNFQLAAVSDSSESMLAAIGSAITPVFKPLGFGDWRMSTALITGLTAKEAVVSTLTVLTGASGGAALTSALAGLITPLGAYSFLVFTLLYMPCVAAMAAVRRELGSWRAAAAAMAAQTAVAWLVAFAFYAVGSLLI